MGDHETEPPPVDTPTPVSTISSAFLAPSLRLSKRQRSILGIGGTPLPPTEKQKLRNIEAGKRLRAYHEHRKTQRGLEAKSTTASLEKQSRVVIESPKKRVSLKKQRVPEPSQSSDESSSDRETRRRVKKASKTAKAIEKLDARIAKVITPPNPYLDLMMKF